MNGESAARPDSTPDYVAVPLPIRFGRSIPASLHAPCTGIAGRYGELHRYSIRYQHQSSIHTFSMNKHTAVISCILGKAFDAVYPAPLPGKSFFFSNRKDIVDEIESKGWKYIFLDMPLSDDDAISSLQAKYVKFLQFLKEDRFQWFSEFDDIVYVDHKFLLTAEHLEYIENTKQKAILLRKTPRLKTTVWDEVNDAILQERYRRFMPETKAYIDSKLQEGCSDTVRICNTGLIAFDHKNYDVLAFADQIYSDLISIGTAECQIIWAMVSQQHSALIQTIDWDELPIVWEAPRR